MVVDLTQWSASDAVDAVASMIKGALADVCLSDGGARPVLGVALAAPGIVSRRGVLHYAPGLAWDSPDLHALLRRSLSDVLDPDSPVLVDNEANLATLAEQHYGVHPGVSDMVYVLADRGVGAGVLVDGRLFRGAHRSAGEVGHVTIHMDGPRCSCGKRGCWAMYVGLDALLDRIADGRRGRQSTSWPRGSPPTASDVAAAARRGDALAVEALTAVRSYLAAGIGNLVSMYDPDLVVLGGAVSTAFVDSVDALREETGSWLMGGQRLVDVRIELSTLGPDASRWGGVRAVLGQISQDARLLAPVG